MRVTTVLLLGGRTATGFVVPPEVVEGLGAGRRPPVTVTVRGYSYRSTVAVRGGQYLVSLSAEHRAAAGVAAGDELEIDLELDTEPRVVEVPTDLGAALDAAPGARAAFDRLAYTHRREHVRAVEEAKAPATRQRRIDAAVAKLTGGEG